MGSRLGDALTHQSKTAETWQRVDAVFHILDQLDAIPCTEEVCGCERCLDLGHVAAADDRPLVLEEPLRDALRLAVVLQQVARVARVVRRVAALLAHDAAEELAEHGMVGDLGKPVVGRVGRPLVDGTPGHVDGRKLANTVAERPEDDRAPEQVTLVEATHLDQPRVVGRPIVRRKHAPESLAVPILLVVPQREEGSELRVLPCGHQQQLARVQNCLIFDVVHVREAAQHVGVQGLAPERFEVDVVGLEPTTLLLKLLDGDRHINPSLRKAVRID